MIRFKLFFRKWQNILASIIVLGFILVAGFAPLLAPQENPEIPVTLRRPEGERLSSLHIPREPSDELPLGTSPFGFDIYFSLIWGTREALRFGLVTAVVTAMIGIVLGAVSGYVGGIFNRVVLRITDAFLTFPAIAGIFLFNQLMKPLTWDGDFPPLAKFMMQVDISPVMIALILFSWMPYTRIINAGIARLKHEEYAMAARTIGARHFRAIFRHLLPNTISPAIVMAARDVGALVILESAFTFIGLGGATPWGVILANSKDWVIGPGGNPLVYWWVFVPVTLALVIFGIGWNLLGDGLNDLLNPKVV